MVAKTAKLVVMFTGLFWGAVFTVSFLYGPFSVFDGVLQLAVLILLQLTVPLLLLWGAVSVSFRYKGRTLGKVALCTGLGALALALSEGLVLAAKEIIKTVIIGNWTELACNMGNALGFGTILAILPGALVSLVCGLLLFLRKKNISGKDNLDNRPRPEL